MLRLLGHQRVAPTINQRGHRYLQVEAPGLCYIPVRPRERVFGVEKCLPATCVTSVNWRPFGWLVPRQWWPAFVPTSFPSTTLLLLFLFQNFPPSLRRH